MQNKHLFVVLSLFFTVYTSIILQQLLFTTLHYFPVSNVESEMIKNI